jgi:very-short-patch-repair endonuclease
MRRAHVPDQLRVAPFTTADAAAAGLSQAALQSSPWRHVFLNVWVHRDVAETREMRLAAVRLVLPDHAVLCGLTAAWIHGVDVRREDDLDVHVGFPKGKRLRKRPGLHVCQETLAADDWMVIDGVRVTTPVRTAFDCLRWLRGAERLVVADALTHAELVTVEDLFRYFAGKKRLRNLRRGEALLDDIEPKSESPMETRLRVEMTNSGLPRPAAQFEVRTRCGEFVGRVDLAYPEARLAIEYDGAWHWKQRRDDDRRRARIRAQDWEVLVFDADDVYRTPLAMCAEIATMLRARAA